MNNHKDGHHGNGGGNGKRVTKLVSLVTQPYGPKETPCPFCGHCSTASSSPLEFQGKHVIILAAGAPSYTCANCGIEGVLAEAVYEFLCKARQIIAKTDDSQNLRALDDQIALAQKQLVNSSAA